MSRVAIIGAFGIACAVAACDMSEMPQGVTGDAIAQIVAAERISRDCAGIGTFAGIDTQDYVMAASRLAAEQQRLSVNALRAPLFYQRVVVLEAAAKADLEGRGVDIDDTRALCAFGNSVAGTGDAIGRFLRKT
ncbi:MAG: hypothetical protein AAGF94_04870 [Pseudomonadota bacterium]